MKNEKHLNLKTEGEGIKLSDFYGNFEESKPVVCICNRWVPFSSFTPKYYDVVLAKTKQGQKLIWRASNGDDEIYTIWHSDDTIDFNDLISWCIDFKINL